MGLRAAEAMRGRQHLTEEQLLERLHGNIYNRVSEAVIPIQHMEKQWSPTELMKRVTGYIYKAAKSPEVQSGTWTEAAIRIIDQAFNGYGAACGERPWFYEIRLQQAFVAAVWEVVQARPRDRVSFAKVEDHVVSEFDERLDRCLLNKAMWDATQKIFSERNAPSKVFQALCKSYDTVLDECFSDSRPLEDLHRVQDFLKRWVDESMRRAWTSVENSETVITERTVIQLFANLIAPFGDDHAFSCIPVVLTDKIGRPPADWPYLKQVVRQMFASWRQENSGGTSKRRKTASGSAEGGEIYGSGHPDTLEGDSGGPAAEPAFVPVAVKKLEPEDEESLEEDDDEDPDVDGSAVAFPPACTSAQDCTGHPDSALVRHMNSDVPGDVYCEHCWAGFLEQGHVLVGVWEGGDDHGQLVQLA